MLEIIVPLIVSLAVLLFSELVFLLINYIIYLMNEEDDDRD